MPWTPAATAAVLLIDPDFPGRRVAAVIVRATDKTVLLDAEIDEVWPRPDDHVQLVPADNGAAPTATIRVLRVDTVESAGNVLIEAPVEGAASRTSERVAWNRDVTWAPMLHTGEFGASFTGTGLDLSLGGMAFASHTPPSPGHLIGLWLTLPRGWIHGRARVLGVSDPDPLRRGAHPVRTTWVGLDVPTRKRIAAAVAALSEHVPSLDA